MAELKLIGERLICITSIGWIISMREIPGDCSG
jgi:hypothetical protein